MSAATEKVAAIVGGKHSTFNIQLSTPKGDARLARIPGPDGRFWQALAAAEDMASDGDWNLAVTALELALHEARVRCLDAKADAAGVVG